MNLDCLTLGLVKTNLSKLLFPDGRVMKKKYIIINSLTSLRFFAALGVFMHHLGVIGQSSIPGMQLTAKYFFNGYVGVTFFYILSGFIINYSFNRHIDGGKFDYKDFIVFRVCRLFPVHILSLLLVLSMFGYFLNFDAVNKWALLFNVSLLNAFIPDPKYYFSFNPVSWSISCELFFYMAFCLLVKLRTSKLILLLVMIQACNAYFIFNPPIEISNHWFFYINPVFRVCDFIIGMLLCRFFLQTDFSPSKHTGTVMEAGALFFVALTVFISTNYIGNMNVRYDLLFIPCMTFLVMAFSFNAGSVSKILSNKFLILLGEASFAFYMLHWMIVSKLSEIINPDVNDMSSLTGYIIAALVVSVVSSIVVFSFYEKPINTFIRKSWVNYRYQEDNSKTTASA